MFKTRLNNLVILGLIGIIVLPLLRTAGVAADTAQNLNVQLSPLPIELTATPGGSVSTDLRIRNGGEQDETLKITLESVSQNGPTGQIALHDFGPGDALPTWVHFSKTVFDAPAGQWQTIPMTINVPPSAAYGYYFAVQFQLAQAVTPKPGQAGIQAATDIFILLNAYAPGESAKAQITKFSVEHKVYEFLPAHFDVQVHNAGNIHVTPHGNIFINRGSSQIGSVSINSSLAAILPNSNRLFTASWNDGFPVYTDVLDANGQSVSNGHGQAKQHLTWNFSQVPKLRFGNYTAHLVMVYNDGRQDVPINATLSFWVIPWRLLAVFLVVGLLVLAGLWSTIKKVRRFTQANRKAPKT